MQIKKRKRPRKPRNQEEPKMRMNSSRLIRRKERLQKPRNPKRHKRNLAKTESEKSLRHPSFKSPVTFSI